MCVCVCVCGCVGGWVCISIYCQAQIDVSLAINLSEIFHSGLYYSTLLFIYFLEEFPNTSKCFLLLACSLKSWYHCTASESGCFCGFLILHEETLHLTFMFFFFVGIVNIACSLSSPSAHTYTHTYTHTHTHTHTHFYSSHLFSRSRNIVKVI